MPKKKEHLEYGAHLRALRTAARLSRRELAARLDCSWKTIAQVEQGYQALGRKYRERIEQIMNAPPGPANSGGRFMISEAAARYRAGPEPRCVTKEPLLDVVMRLVLDEDLPRRAAEVAKVLETSEDTGARIIVRRELEKGGWL